MFSDVTSHLVYQVLNAPIREYPFPHFFSTNMFPEAFYAEIMKHMPADDAYQTLLEQGLVKVSPNMMGILDFEIGVNSLEQLNKVIKKIETIPNVVFVERRSVKKKAHI